MKVIYRTTLVCADVPVSAAVEDAACIEQDFAFHRLHHQNVRCELSDRPLTLTAENDFDSTGLALMDEFSDLITACIAEHFDGTILVRSIVVL